MEPGRAPSGCGGLPADGGANVHRAGGAASFKDRSLAVRRRADAADAIPDLGWVIMFGSSSLFAFLTLPVELNASSRAEQLLVSQSIIRGGGPMGWTYVAAAVSHWEAGCSTSCSSSRKLEGPPRKSRLERSSLGFPQRF